MKKIDSIVTREKDKFFFSTGSEMVSDASHLTDELKVMSEQTDRSKKD